MKELENLIAKSFSDFAQQFGDGVMRLGEAAMEYIKIRTKRGIGADGRPFTAYSDKYAARKGQQSVDLYGNRKVSGGSDIRMLDNMEVRSGGIGRADARIRSSAVRGAGGRFESLKNQEVVIGFTDPTASLRARAHHEGRGNLPPRPFMALDDLWVQEGVDRTFREISIPGESLQVEIRVL